MARRRACLRAARCALSRACAACSLSLFLGRLDALRTDLALPPAAAALAPPLPPVDAAALGAALDRAGGAVERIKRSSADFGSRAHAVR